MSKKFFLTEEEKQEIRKKYFFEQSEIKKEDGRFCHKGNTKRLEEIVGGMDPEDFIVGVKMRKGGVNGLADAMELLKSSHLLDGISDGGEGLAFEVMNTLKGYKPYKDGRVYYIYPNGNVVTYDSNGVYFVKNK